MCRAVGSCSCSCKSVSGSSMKESLLAAENQIAVEVAGTRRTPRRSRVADILVVYVNYGRMWSKTL
jgi:hypothetical protein